MEERIEILNPEMMKEYVGQLELIEYWAKLLRTPIGWHYWLDFIWILNCIEEICLAKNAWILDAGAGNGLLQFMLASCGYNIISLDYAERDIPVMASRIFNITKKCYLLNNPDHAYRKFISHKRSRIEITPRRVVKAISQPGKAVRYLFNDIMAPRFAFLFNRDIMKKILEAKLGRSSYGEIIYAYGDFTDLHDFQSQSIDCIVSVSALEHAGKGDIKKAFKEFNRVLKKKGYMFLTLSAAQKQDWFFDPCQGWCFTEAGLRELFELKTAVSNFKDYDALFSRLEQSSEIEKRIPKEYFQSGNNGLPWGVYKPRYQPVGIVKRNQ